MREPNLKPVLPVVPSQGRREMLNTGVDAVVSAEAFLIARQYDGVLAGLLHTNTVVREGICRMEVENEQ